MKDNVRKRIINEINKGISDKKSLPDKYEKLKQLQKNSYVVEYLQLESDIKKIENEINSYKDIYGKLDDSLDKRIEKSFSINSRYNKACEHPIWLYRASYYEFFGNFVPLNDEYVKHFSAELGYNEYICLECNRSVEVADWEKFEIMHCVLRDGDKRPNIEYYQNLYYRLLYYNLDFAQIKEMIVDEFYKNKESNYKLTKKK